METSTSNEIGRRIRVLAIETSCDETAIAIVEGQLTQTSPEQGALSSAASFTVLGNALISQIDIHKEYGGVYPMVAKREHAKNLVPLLGAALEEAGMYLKEGQLLPADTREEIIHILEREGGLSDALLNLLSEVKPPELDAIAVTAGPGLEPALWVGVSFAKALSLAWGLPIVSVNHMEGHICTALATIPISESTDEARLEDSVSIGVIGVEVSQKNELRTNATHLQQIVIPKITLPLLSLLISGGHTELVLSRAWGSYELVGATRDDAVGEAFDKVARMLGLPYPGGPEVSKLAERARASGRENPITLPRPMLHDPHCNFSFSGLKTAVLYMTKDKDLSDIEKEDMARAFEDAATDVLYAKSKRALENTGALTLALGGGVSANTHIKRTFTEHLANDYPDVHLALPVPALTTDNAIMIGLAGFYHAQKAEFADIEALRADGNRKLR